jgi:2-haloacid dehalogenase
MTPPWLKDITHLTFDCYGTLIDWERGILSTVQPLLAGHGVTVPPEEILRSYVRHEASLESQGWKPYSEILRGVMLGIAADFNIQLTGNQAAVLAGSLPDWPPFPDTVTSLQRLSSSFQLVILSNTDDALFAETQKRLRVRFVEVITAEQVRSYKPGHAHFQEARRRLNVSSIQVLHVAQSFYHDHVPAQQLGFKTAWVKRPSLLADTGLAPAAIVKPDIVVPDLACLVTQLSERLRAG